MSNGIIFKFKSLSEFSKSIINCSILEIFCSKVSSLNFSVSSVSFSTFSKSIILFFNSFNLLKKSVCFKLYILIKSKNPKIVLLILYFFRCNDKYFSIRDVSSETLK